MNDYKYNVIDLLTQYCCGEITTSQHQELMEWVNKSPENRFFFEQHCNGEKSVNRFGILRKINTERAIKHFDQRTGQKNTIYYLRKWMPYTAAAVILIACVISFFFLENRVVPTVSVANQIGSPGTTKAVLILAGGKQIGLNGRDSLQMELQNGVTLTNEAAKLVYNTKENKKLKGQWNELRIPRGGEYRVVLSDGTMVYLNSATTLRYPIVFGDTKREVQFSGEAYFEVAKDQKRPFYVTMDGIKIRVYGTSFNVNTHHQDYLQTALVSGKVGIQVDGLPEEFMMEPSQLACLNRKSLKMEITTTDLTPYIAWKNQLFVFDNERLEDIMNTISLWYDIDVFYTKQTLKELHFTGLVKRYDKIDHLLQALQQTVGVRFEQKNRLLTVTQ